MFLLPAMTMNLLSILSLGNSQHTTPKAGVMAGNFSFSFSSKPIFYRSGMYII
jgi:hypothetical protein